MKFHNGSVTLSRSETMTILINTYGNECFLCHEKPTANDPLNIDHWHSQFWCKQQGLSEEFYHDISNLRPMHESCNRRKGHLPINEDGTVTLPPVKERTAPGNVHKREPCQLCDEGHLLFIGEECDFCGSGPQPARWPAVYQKRPKDCQHAGLDHCWMCVLDFVPRQSAVSNLLVGNDPTEME